MSQWGRNDIICRRDVRFWDYIDWEACITKLAQTALEFDPTRNSFLIECMAIT